MIKHDLKPAEYFIDPVKSDQKENLIQLRIGIEWYKRQWAAGKRNDIIQIGPVLGTYGYCETSTIDMVESQATIDKEYAAGSGQIDFVDMNEFDFTGKSIISLNAFNKTHYTPAILSRVAEMSDSYLVTFTPGSNPEIDDHVKQNEYDWHGWQRLSAEEWDYTAQDENVWEKRPDSPFPSANGIILLQKTGDVS
tara:strand:- start:116 stop:697 length:582 start_codon:yes stop_codon:yes gene_type:complete